MEHALDNGLLVGDNGKINAGGTLSRAQMGVIMTRAFGAEEQTDITHFEDVSSKAWYYNDLSRAVAMGALKGTSANSIRPEAAITREEAFAVLSRLFGAEKGDVSVLKKFKDWEEVSPWAEKSLAAMVQAGFVGGNNGNLNPKANITRAEFAAMMDRLVCLYIDADTKVPETIRGNVILREGADSLKGKTINGNLILSDGLDRIDLNGVTVTGKIIIRGGEGTVVLRNVKADQVVVDGVSDLTKLDLKGGAINQLTVNKGNLSIMSDKTVKDVLVNGNNVKVNIPDANITVGPNAENVENENQPMIPPMGGGGMVPPEGGDGEVPGPNPGPNPGQDPTPDPEKPEIGTTKEVPADYQFVYEKDKSGKFHYALRFTPLAAKGTKISVDAVSRATDGGGMLPVPDESAEMKAMYQYVNTIKTDANETQVASVLVGGTKITEIQQDSQDGTGQYYVGTSDIYSIGNKIIFSNDLFDGKKNVTVVVKVPGYKELMIPVNGQPTPEVKPDQPEGGEKEVPASWQFTHVADGTAKGHYEIQFDLPKTVREDALIDAVSSATNEGGGDGDGGGDLGGGDGDDDFPIIPGEPEVSPEFQALYHNVKTLKTHYEEVKDSSITVNGVEVTESMTLTLGETNSFLVQESKLTPTGNKVALSADLFDNKNQVKVVIHVKGYKDLELVVDGRTLLK